MICFQEAINKSNGIPTIAKYVKDNTDLKYYVEYELCDTHINVGCRTGITICSKYKIEYTENIALENPNFQKIIKNKIIYTYEKGFIYCKINKFNIFSGHTLPFYYFEKDIKDYLYIYEQLDKRISEICNISNNIILCGDFNYENAKLLFPNTFKYCHDLINSPTNVYGQLDHFIVNNKMIVKNGKILNTTFDHKLVLFEVEEN